MVPAKLKANVVPKAIEDAGGTATAETVPGGSLNDSLDGDTVVIADARGNTVNVTATDLKAKNGVLHVIDNVLMP